MIHDASSPSIATHYTKPTTSSPFGTNQRPRAVSLVADLSTTRAKSTLSRPKDVSVKKNPSSRQPRSPPRQKLGQVTVRKIVDPATAELQVRRVRSGVVAVAPTVRRVLHETTAEPRLDKSKMSTEAVAEQMRVSGKELARLTDQVALVTGLNIAAFRRDVAKRSKTRSVPSRSSKKKSVIRTVTPTTKHGESIVRTVMSTYEHRSREGLSFTMRSIQLDLPISDPQPIPPQQIASPPNPSSVYQSRNRLRGIIRHIHRLSVELSNIIPTPPPVSITKHAVAPPAPQRRYQSARSRHTYARRNRQPTRQRRVSVLSNRSSRTDKSRCDNVSGRKGIVRQVLSVKQASGEAEPMETLQDEVASWMGGGGGTGSFSTIKIKSKRGRGRGKARRRWAKEHGLVEPGPR